MEFLKTRKGLAALGGVCVMLAYICASFAIETGSILLYLLTLAFSYLAIQSFSMAIWFKKFKEYSKEPKPIVPLRELQKKKDVPKK